MPSVALISCAWLSELEGYVMRIALSAFLLASVVAPVVRGDDTMSTFLRSVALMGYRRFEPPPPELMGKPFGLVASSRVGDGFTAPPANCLLLDGGFAAELFLYII